MTDTTKIRAVADHHAGHGNNNTAAALREDHSMLRAEREPDAR